MLKNSRERNEIDQIDKNEKVKFSERDTANEKFKKQIDDIFKQNMNVEKIYQMKNELDERNIKIAEYELKIDKLENYNSEFNHKQKTENNVLEENND